MDARRVQETARRIAEGLPQAVLDRPFGPETEVFKAGDKAFLLIGDMPVGPAVTVKADPSEAEALRQAHEGIVPGYYMNKRHWVTVGAGDSVDEALVEELVVESYRLVVAALPRARRPVDPATFRLRGPKSPS